MVIGLSNKLYVNVSLFICLDQNTVGWARLLFLLSNEVFSPLSGKYIALKSRSYLPVNNFVCEHLCHLKIFL